MGAEHAIATPFRDGTRVGHGTAIWSWIAAAAHWLLSVGEAVTR